MIFWNIKNKILGILDEAYAFYLALVTCINDYRFALKAGITLPVCVKYENKRAYIIENKYKSFLVTLINTKYQDFVRVQLCKRQGKIVDGMMIPEPIAGAFLDIEIKKMYSFIEIFRIIGNEYISDSKQY